MSRHVRASRDIHVKLKNNAGGYGENVQNCRGVASRVLLTSSPIREGVVSKGGIGGVVGGPGLPGRRGRRSSVVAVVDCRRSSSALSMMSKRMSLGMSGRAPMNWIPVCRVVRDCCPAGRSPGRDMRR